MQLHKHINLFILLAIGLATSSSMKLVGVFSSYSETQAKSPFSNSSSPMVLLQAASGSTIQYFPNNGVPVAENPARPLSIPHLTLTRNKKLTDLQERTLFVSITGLRIPYPGATVTLEIETQHADPDSGGDEAERIKVWNGSAYIPATFAAHDEPVSLSFIVEFEQYIFYNGRSIKTPTDYYRYEVTVNSKTRPSGLPLYHFSADFAFLMENQWIVPLGDVFGNHKGEGPSELAIFYCDMFPFGTDLSLSASQNRMPRNLVDDFIGTELAPALKDAYRLQTQVWGFAWNKEWVSYRAGRDEHRLTVALFKQGVWYHGRASGAGHSGISIRVDGGMAEYATLIDGIIATFHHELFHNLQRSLNLHMGGDGLVGGKENVWDFFSEGIAELATSVGQPEIQFNKTWGQRSYLRKVSGFTGSDGISAGDLNKSYTEISPYNSVLYWRFLYERCGGMADLTEDPSVGMQVIRKTLEVLYSGDVIDISRSTELVLSLPTVMDRVFEISPECPFATFNESLVHFARAIYLLRVEDGRCLYSGVFDGCGFYDPNLLFPVPKSQVVVFPSIDQNGTNQELHFTGNIPSSFGIDFIDIIIDPEDTTSLFIEISSRIGAEAELNAQIILLGDYEKEHEEGFLPARVNGSEITTFEIQEKSLVYLVSNGSVNEVNRIGIILTRLDPLEHQDPVGEYTLNLRSK
jgi:hypothetical protein